MINVDQTTMSNWMNYVFDVPSDICYNNVTSAAGSSRCYPKNELTLDYTSNSSSTIDRQATATHDASSSLPPPRPQRPLTEYNIFFRLERELLLQGKSDNRDALEQSKAEQKILSSGKEIESTDVSAHRPPQYRHLIMPTDWMVVGSSASQVTPPGAKPFDRRASDKSKETRAKFTFLELTKLISSRWREVCQNDPKTKEFCKKIADIEAARYREELEEYRAKYGVEAAKGKQRKKRKSLPLSKSQKKTKQVKEEGVIPKLRIEEDSEEDIRPSPTSGLESSSQTTLPPDFVNMLYVRQQELQARLEQSQRRLASLRLGSSFTINTFEGIPKDFTQAQMFQGAIITPNPPSDDRYEQGGQMLQDGYKNLQMLSATRQHTSQPFVRQNSAFDSKYFDSKYDFLNDDDGVNDDEKVKEYLREFERNVFQQLLKSSTYEDASGFGVGDNLHLQECHRKCIEESRCCPSEVSKFYFENKQSEVMTITTSSETREAVASKLKKLRSLQSYDWIQFTETVEIQDDEDIEFID